MYVYIKRLCGTKLRRNGRGKEINKKNYFRGQF